jgi:hypothetical protein
VSKIAAKKFMGSAPDHKRVLFLDKIRGAADLFEFVSLK